MSKVLKALLLISASAMALTTLMCGYDCVVAHIDEAPVFLFSFLLPVLQEEFVGGGRLISLAASLMLPGLAVLLPVVTVALGIAVKLRCERGSRWAAAARLLIIVSSALLCINLYSAYAIYRTFAAI